MASLPSSHRALVLETVEAGFKVRNLPTSRPEPGNAIVRVLHAAVLSYHREIYNGERRYSYPTPIVGGISAIARVVALGPDATALQPGQLIFVDCVIRGRDDPSAIFLTAIHEGSTPGSRKLMHDVWRNGTFAEYAKVPLENCIPLDEARLCTTLGYATQDLMFLSNLLVPYGGFRDIRLEPGETVVVCPATGAFGGAGVQVAAAMGARVIAMGRNETELARLKSLVAGRATVETVKITGDEAADTAALKAFGVIDAVLDLSPPQAANSTHLHSAVAALKRGGRVSVMGFTDYPVGSWKVVGDDISFRGKLMYEREDIVQFVKMLERGLFPSGQGLVKVKAFGLEEWKEAFDEAAVYAGAGKLVVLTP